MEISVDLGRRIIIPCQGKQFSFELHPIDEALLHVGGLLSVCKEYGAALFRRLQSAADVRTAGQNNSTKNRFHQSKINPVEL